MNKHLNGEENLSRKSSCQDKKFFLGDGHPSPEQSDNELDGSRENLPTITISSDTGKKLECLHVSLPNVTMKTSYSANGEVDNSRLYPEISLVNSNLSQKREKLSFEEDCRSLVKLISNLQNIVDSLSAKYARIDSNKSNKQLNFRSHDDIINATKELMSTEFGTNKEFETLNRPETKRSDDFSFYFRNKNRMETPDCELFLETEKLLDGRVNGVPNLKWSDANSVTSPCSTVPESPFDSGKKIRSQNIIYPRRSVLKNGECNVLKKSSNSKRRVRYLQDIFTTLVDVKWRWTLVVFALSFIMSWLFYAGVYWLIAYAHGDFDHLDDEKWTPCVENLVNFASCFLFSVETQHTIGYGGRATTEECPEAIFVMCIQSITGVMISAFMAGIFFAKMARPKQRRQTLLFSRKAVICRRDAQMCLMFRVGDMRKSHIIGTNIRAHLFRSRTTREGEELPQYQCELQVFADGCESNIFFIWPLTIVHVINKDSPLYTMSAQDLLQENFEVVAILEGTVESTGQTTQARTSYLPNEIKWGHRFESLLSYNVERQCYEIDYKNFNNTVKVATPLCSAKDLEELYVIQSEMCDYNVITSDPDTDNQASTNSYLHSLGRDNAQLLINKIWELPTEKYDDVTVANLPEPLYVLPRAMPVPKPKPLTKWEKFAKEKGIVKKKKDKLKWDDILKKWVPLYGYRRAEAEKDKDWVLEVPENADPYEDQFAKKKLEKSERTAKNEFQRLRNLAQSKNIKLPKLGFAPTSKPSPSTLGAALTVAKASTASLGKFQESLPKEKETKNVKHFLPSGSKRKLPIPKPGEEKEKNMKLIDNILNKKPKLNIDQAIDKEIHNENKEEANSKKTKKSKKNSGRKTKKGAKGGKFRGPSKVSAETSGKGSKAPMNFKQRPRKGGKVKGGRKRR